MKYISNYYYVYYSYEEWGRGYIGHRGCNCLPEKDTKYFGSFTDKTFKPTQKIILDTFKSKEEAVIAEISLHSFYQVDINLHFANRAKQTSSGFCYTYLPVDVETARRQKISKKTLHKPQSGNPGVFLYQKNENRR